MPFLASPMRFLIHYVAVRPWSYALLTLIVIAGSASSVGVQYAMKLLIDAMTGPHHTLAGVHLALAAFVALVVLENGFARLSAVVLALITVASGVRIRLDMFDYLIGHQLSFFQSQRSGALGHRVSALSASFATMIHRILLQILPPLITFVGALLIFVSIDWAMAAVLAVFFLAISLALIRLGARGDSHHQDFARTSGDGSGELIDILSNIWSVKAFAARQRESLRLRGFFRNEAKAQRRAWYFVEGIRALHDLALVLLVGGTLTWAVWRWSAGAISAGDVVVVSAMTFRMLNGSRDLAMALIETNQQASYLAETLSVIGVPQTLVDAPGAPPLRRGDGSIRLERVTFGYDPQAPVLHDVSITVPAGQKVGIVGPSGAGKSSILHLVQRLSDAQTGAVLVDGQRVDTVQQESLHKALAVVPQEVLLFHRSILENIRFARPDATDEAVHHAAQAARCARFIEQMPDGYDTLVGERGTNLSGGQRQRIGIARAFLKDARIVLLDEATAALDTGAELEVQQGLDALVADRTVLAVAHRLATVIAFDRILVIENGRVVEDGPPMTLLEKGGTFQRLWAMQVEGLDMSDVAPLG